MRGLSLVPFLGLFAGLTASSLTSCATSQDVETNENGGTGNGGATSGGAAGSTSGGTAGSGTGGGGTSSGGGVTDGSAEGSTEAGTDGGLDGATFDGSSGGNGGGGTANGGTANGGTGGLSAGGSGGGTGSGKTCSSGFVTGVDSGGNVVCETVSVAAQNAVHQSCSIYLGWRDSCDNCSSVPDKWGRASGSATCVDGTTGRSNVCIAPTLGTNVVSLFGINTDGDVTGDDKFYTTLHCAAGTPATTTGQTTCPAGQFVTAVTGSTVSCATMADLVTAYFDASCRVYFGWRDSCDPCSTAPFKWGSASDSGCTNGGNVTDNTCTTPTLGTESVQLFGLNTDGDVDGNDSFYMGMHCTGATAATTTNQTACPAGQFVTAVNSNNTVNCASPAVDIQNYVRSGCYSYLGWRDSCSGCSTAPAKWGRANDTTCEKDPTSDSLCLPATSLGGESVNLFVMNTDGDVNDDDQFYVGLACY